MSANNQLIIKKNKNKEFEVHINSCVDNPFRASKNTLIKKFKTLDGAIKFANNYCHEEGIEYGTYFDI